MPLIFEDGAKERLRELFAHALETDTVTDLVDRLHYLDHYGSDPSVRHARCRVLNSDGGDRRPGRSIGVLMEKGRYNPATSGAEWDRIWYGGLVFHESAPPGVRAWGVHT